MSENVILTKLLNAILNKADRLLKESGEFYPFAMSYTDKGEIIPVNVYSGKEYPKASEHLLELKAALTLRYSNYGIGINSSYKHFNQNKTEDAIEIRLTIENEEYESSYVPYVLNEDGGVIFDDMFV